MDPLGLIAFAGIRITLCLCTSPRLSCPMYVLDVMQLSSNISNVLISKNICSGHYQYQKSNQYDQNLCLFVVLESQRVQVSWTKEDIKNLMIASMGTK